MSRNAFIFALCGALGIATLAPSALLAQVIEKPALAVPDNQAEAVPAGQDAMQVLEQGPVHEAFAEPVVLEATEGIVVDRAPPDVINELPPEVRPEGNNVEWISGYWMWSDLKKDFVWVSGVWRDIPPGRRWVPGHWTQVAQGFQWVPGFWAGEQAQEINLLPTPPETLEAGPNSAAPGDNYFWVPGSWIWQISDYVWRPGYWYVGQPNWVWVPDHYCYTGGGAYFVNGYWDYPLASRGLLYAPVYWSRPIYNNPGWYYRPRSVIDSALLLTALFVNPYHSHYYYGYGGWGSNWYRPWWAWGWGGNRVYDPFYSYHRWHDGRNQNNWHDHVRQDWNRHHRDWDRGDWNRGGRDGDRGGRGTRPGDFVGAGGIDGLVKNIDQYRQARGNTVRLQDLNPKQMQAALDRSQNWQQIRQARIDAEASARTGGDVQPSDRPGRGNRGPDGTPGSARNNSGQVASTAPGGGRRLQTDGNGAPRASFRLPAQSRAELGQANRQTLPGAVRTQLGDGSRRVELPQNGGAADAIRRNADQLRQRNVASPGSARVQVPGGSSALSRSFSSSRGQANVQIPSGIQQRSLRVPTDGGVRIQPGGQQRNFSVPSGGQPRSIQAPSGGSRSFSAPQRGGASRSIRIPSSGGGRSFSAPSASSFRGFSGGGGSANIRSGGGGGGQHMFRGGGGNHGARGGGGGNHGGGGGRGHGRH